MSDTSIALGANAVVDVLAHYGKKGMKWGVTTVDKSSQPTLKREKKALLSPKEVTVRQRKAGTFVQTRGGKRQVATPEAINAAAGRQKAKKSTTDSLTNAELKATNERMQLETKFHDLSKKSARINRGKRIANAIFGSGLAREAVKLHQATDKKK